MSVQPSHKMKALAVRLRELSAALKRADPDIVDIIQFGSSVYAPDLARDVDLLITTRQRKDDDLYWEVFSGLDCGVDVMVREPGQRVGGELAAHIYLLGEVLLGNGETLKEMETFMAVPTFDRAREALATADMIVAMARTSDSEIRRDEFYKVGFNRLFDASRYAVMAFLHTENARWGQLRKALPAPFDRQFREMINVLHIQYSYEGNYPKDDPERAFAEWRNRVEDFIRNLEGVSRT